MYSHEAALDSLVKDPRAITAIVSEKDNVVGSLLLGVVVRGTRPSTSGSRSLGLLGLGLATAVGRGRLDRGLGAVLCRGGRLHRFRLGCRRRLGSLSRSGGGRGRGRRGLCSIRAKVVVLPGDNLAIDGGRDPLGTLLLALLVEVLVAMAAGVDMRRGSDITLLVRAEVIDGKLLEVKGATDVDGELEDVSLVSYHEW